MRVAKTGSDTNGDGVMLERRRTPRAFSLAFSLALAAVFAVACGDDGDESGNGGTTATTAEGGESSPGENGGGDQPSGDIDFDATLRVGVELAGRVGFDPVADGGGFQGRANYLDLIYDTMLQRLGDGTIVPNQAESWETPDDFTLILNLRDDIVFHDGTPFNAEAVKFSWDRCIAHPTVLKLSEQSAMESVEVLDEFVVQLNLSAPIVGAFLDWVLAEATFCMGVASPTAVQTLGDEGFEAAPVGAGPYRFERYVPDQSILLVRNDDYWAPVNFAEIEFIHITPGPSVITGLVSGEVDVAGMPSGLIPQAEAAGLDLYTGPSTSTMYVYVCQNISPFDNVDARRALSLAINREQIVQTALQGGGVVNPLVISPIHWAWNEEMATSGTWYDLEEARALADSSGLSGSTFDLMVIGTNPVWVAAVEVLQSQLAEIGVTVNIVPTQNPFTDKHAQLPELEIWALQHSTMGTVLLEGEINNYCGNQSDAIDEATNRVWRVSDDASLETAWHDYQQAVADDIPIIPMVTELGTWAHNTDDRLTMQSPILSSSRIDLRQLSFVAD